MARAEAQSDEQTEDDDDITTPENTGTAMIGTDEYIKRLSTPPSNQRR